MTMLFWMVGTSTGQTIDMLFFPPVLLSFNGTTISVIASDMLPRNKYETTMAKEPIIPITTRCGITAPNIHLKQIIIELMMFEFY